MEKLIYHVDVNSAFLSWEAARRVEAGEADLRLIPSAIGGDREKRTGVILAKSIPAKKFGVKTGEPVGMALRKCPDLYLARPDFKLYERNSRRFMDICRRYAPVVEKYSIDECFLDMSGTSLIYPDPVAIAHEIKDTIRDELGFTVNIGISRNKILAKMASDFEKPDRVHTLFPEEVPAKMWPMPVRELFSIGRATAERLETANIRTIGELAAMELGRLQFLVGNKMGTMLHDYANGIDDSPVLAQPEEAKGYSNSTTLEEDVTEFEQANVILLALTDSVSARMRADGVKACCISVTVRSNDFKDRSHQKKLEEATDITAEIYEIVKQLFAELWDGKTPLRLLGVAVTDISREDYVQQSLFFDEKREKARKIDKAVDNIRGRYGTDAISRGSAYGLSSRVGSKHKAQIELEQEKKNKKTY
ncbi:MAG: DNA polymerase IV [Clostridiales bacterium]|nr:DNA polymerase IV [Clostridiales bacterium]